MIEDGTMVKVHYTGTLDDGSVFDSSIERDPLAFTIGAGQVIAGFDAAVKVMDVGGTSKVTIPSAEAYGAVREDMVITIAPEQFPEGITPAIGQMFQLNTPQGTIAASVTDVNDAGVTLNANHPLAGKDLTFELTLVSVG